MIPRMPGNACLPCVSLTHLTQNYSLIFGIRYRILPSLGGILIFTPRILLRPMLFFVSIRYHQISRVFLVIVTTWVFIIGELETRCVHLLLVPMASLKWISCAVSVIVPVNTMVNVFYLIAIGPARSPSIWVIPYLITHQFINDWSIIIGYYSNTVPQWVLSWTSLLSYIKDHDMIWIYVCLQMVGI